MLLYIRESAQTSSGTISLLQLTSNSQPEPKAYLVVYVVMRKVILSNILIFLANTSFCQPGIELHQWPIDSSWYTSYYKPQKEFIPFFDSELGKFGVRNGDSVIITPQFDYVDPMFNAVGEKGIPIYTFRKGNFYGWADLWGKYVIYPQFERIDFTAERYNNLRDSTQHFFRCSLNALEALYAINGKEIIPFKYNRILAIHNNLVHVGSFVEDKMIHGLIDTSLNVVIPIEYKNITFSAVYDDLDSLNNPRLREVRISAKNKYDEWVYLGLNNTVLWNHYVSYGYKNFVITKIEGKYGIINIRTKKTIVQPLYKWLRFTIGVKESKEKDFFAFGKFWTGDDVHYFNPSGEIVKEEIEKKY